MSFSFFGDNIIPVDEHGEAIYPMIPGFCGRSYKEVEFIDKVLGADEYARITGNTISTLSTASKILWLSRNHSDIFDRVSAYYTNQQYIMHKLGFGDVQDYTMASRKLIFDVKDENWSLPILDIIRVGDKQLGNDIVESSTVVGNISKYGDVHLPNRIPVVIGCHDVSASLVAAGVDIDNGDTIGVLMGTFEQMGYFSDVFIPGSNDFEDSLIFSCCYNSPFKGRYTIMDAFPTAGALLEWSKDNLFAHSDLTIGELISNAPLDASNTLMYLPFVEKFRGAIIGMSLSTTTDDIFESLLESLAFQFKTCIDYLLTTREKPFSKIYFGGGGSRTDKLLQLRSDLINKDIRRARNIELPSLGAAILSGLGNKWYASPKEITNNYINDVTIFSPDRKKGDIYNEKYNNYREISRKHLLG